MNNWKPMETAPKDRDILMVDKNGKIFVGEYSPRETVIMYLGVNYHPIAWQELPVFDGVVDDK